MKFTTSTENNLYVRSIKFQLDDEIGPQSLVLLWAATENGYDSMVGGK